MRIGNTYGNLTGPRGRRTRRAGFTLIEIIVAVGIIILLIGISVAAIGRIARHNKNHQTQASLETLKLMVQNYIAATNDDACANLDILYSDIPVTTNGIPAPPTPNGNHQINPNTGANGTVYPAVGNGYGTPPLKWSVVFRTYKVMQLLYAVPANRALFDRVPPEQRFYLEKSNVAPPPGGTRPHLDDPFLLADGFGEPIIYVPGVGLGNVKNTVASATWTGTMKSDGRLRDLNQSLGTAPNPGATPPKLGNQNIANQRPFWASAGADHSFTAGDDNVYSFEQR